MAFALLSNLRVSTWFHGLAGFASLLLIGGYALRTRLFTIERVELARLGRSLRQALEVSPSADGGRASLHSIDACAACGETRFLVVRSPTLGTALSRLGIHELRI